MKRTLTVLLFATLTALSASAQSLINIDFGVGSQSRKIGFAATGESTNDFWNLYRHYDPKYLPGSPLVPAGVMRGLKFSDGSASPVFITVTNAPGVWGNATGDPMYDSYIFANNGSNVLVALHGLEPGRYHLYLYGHADPDVTGEQNSVFAIRSGTNILGPQALNGSAGWKATMAWAEKNQFVVFRDVPVLSNTPLLIEVEPGPNGVAVLNGLQIISRGTSPPKLVPAFATQSLGTLTNLIIREIVYDGVVSDSEARFHVLLDIESLTTNEISALLFEGDVALVISGPRAAVVSPTNPERPQDVGGMLPPSLRIVSSAKQYRLFVSAPGRYTIPLELVAKISRVEPWNQISFIGPPAAIASVRARASTPGVEMQLLSGAQTDGEQKASSRLEGFLGSDRTLAMRWQSKTAEITRKSLVTVGTEASVFVTPTVAKFTTELRYEILQAPLPRLSISVPTNQALTKLVGEQIRDWQIKPVGVSQLLTVEFIKPVEKNYALTLYSEQTVESTAASTSLVPPQPLEVQRESGSFSISADDTLVEIDAINGLRQVNASSGTLAAYRFFGRPIELTAKLKRIEPLVKVADRATVRLEETRLVVTHALSLNVERAGIYSLDLIPQPDFVVSEVRGDGVEDWKVTDTTLHLTFTNRVLGLRTLNIQLEQALKQFPSNITVTSLLVTGATNASVQIGAASSGGIRLKTGELAGLREVPATTLPSRGRDELLAFTGEQRDWRLTLSAEKLSARIIAEVFDLITVGDGLVGGSATIRYGIFNQGVQEFRVTLPAHWKNVEFTGPNIRRKEQVASTDTNIVMWNIGLQDKAWGAYTLVVTYDYQFDPKSALLNFAGAHASGVERETGSVGVMSGAGLKLEPKPFIEPLRRVDESELADTDRALATRPLLLAFKYTGTNYALAVQVTRFDQITGLDAIADRTELTTVLTESGQMLTQASFMVKNNDKQFQRFKLPTGAEFWSSYVNGQPARPERDGDWLLVPLPRQADRDQAFAVDIVYAQKINLAKSRLPQRIDLQAPLTDVPNTYAEWQLFAPMSQRLGGFGGNMTVAPYTTYELRDAWREFVQFWGNAIDRNLGGILFVAIIVVFVALGFIAVRRGARAFVGGLVVLAIVAVLASMLLPALSKAKAKAQRISAVNNLKQIALAAKIYSNDHDQRFPNSFDEMSVEINNPKILVDPQNGQRFTWMGAGKTDDGAPDAVLAYSRSENGSVVALADGSVHQVPVDRLEQMIRADQTRAADAKRFLSVNGSAAPREPLATANDPARSGGGFGAGARGAFGNRLEEARSAAGGAGEVQLRLARPAPIDAAGLPMLGAATATPGAEYAQVSLGSGTNVVSAARIAGIRPIRIDIPRIGRAFTFTKVLNVGNEPLAVRTSLMKQSTFRVLQTTWQTTAFIVGLLMIWVLWHRAERSTFWLAVACALVIVSVTGMLLTWRALHLALIALPPTVIVTLLGCVIWKFVPRRTETEVVPPIEPEGTVPTAVALIVFSFVLWNTDVAAAESHSEAVRPIFSKSVSILSANYTGTVREKVAQLDVTVSLSVIGTNETVSLFGDDVAVQQFEITRGNATLLREGRGVGVLFTNSGVAELHFKLVAKVGGDVTRRRVSFTVPPALSSVLNLVIDEAEADVDFPTAIAFTRTNVDHQTRVAAVLGSTDRVEMNWTPRIKRAAEITATVFVHNSALVSFGNGVMNTRAVLDYQVTQGELRSLRMTVPSGHRLLRVEGNGIRTWELSTDGATLTVDLVKGTSPSYRLTVELEKLMDKFPATARVELPHALDVKRETGIIGVRGSEELALSVESLKELRRVDVEEFGRVTKDFPLKPSDGEKGNGLQPIELIGAFRFFRTDFDLVAKAEAVQAQVEAAVRNTARIGFDDVRVNAHVDYTIKRAGIFALRLALPGDYKLESVSGANIQQWAEKLDGTNRVLDVTLNQRTLGSDALDVLLVRQHSALLKTITVVGAHPLDVQKSSGTVVVTSEVGIAAKVESFEALTEIPAGTVGVRPTGDGNSAALAFKLIGTEPSAAANWKLSVTTETVEPWVRAEIVNYLTLSETLISGRATVRYDIANAPVKEFRLRVPAAFRNVEISGANIRRRDQTNDEWRVELQSKVRGMFALTVTWENEKSAASNVVEFTGVTALNVEREVGYVVVSAKPPIQVSEKTLEELLTRIDFTELPAWAERPTRETVLAFKYLRPGYKLSLDVKRYGEAEVLAALIDSAHLTTVVADDGQLMTEVTLSVRNNGRQHLEIELPQGDTKVWSAFVAGEPIRPNVRGGRLLLPLEQSADDRAVNVELTFVSAEKFPKRSGDVALESPKFDVPVKNARWDLYLPPDYDYSRFEGGTMTKVAESAPIVQMFSASEYLSRQNEKAATAQAEMKSELSNVRSNLRGGNYQRALSEYNRAKDKASVQLGDRDELGRIEDEVRRAQSSNLIQAQRKVFFDNAERLGEKEALLRQQDSLAQKPASGPIADYESGVAELQWSRLEAVQQVAKAKIAPLRINLPTRGVKLSFSQVLQTEVQKPLTVKLHATNTKEIGWPRKFLWGALGFAALWSGVAGVSRKRNV